MKQKDKLYHFIKYPSIFGIYKNTRIYKCICDLACDGIATTGYSDKNTKHIETGDVIRILKRLGVACGSMNVAPRGGACGERVFLNGKVRKECITNFDKFRYSFLARSPEKNDFDAAREFIASLQK